MFRLFRDCRKFINLTKHAHEAHTGLAVQVMAGMRYSDSARTDVDIILDALLPLAQLYSDRAPRAAIFQEHIISSGKRDEVEHISIKHVIPALNRYVQAVYLWKSITPQRQYAALASLYGRDCVEEVARSFEQAILKMDKAGTFN
jgi:hypothetical protein